MSASRLGLTFLLALAAGCGAPPPPPKHASEDTPIKPSPRIHLELRRTNGDWVDVADLRGEWVLLFFFATFDGVSQASLDPLRWFVRQYPDIQVVGIAVQPDAPLLVEAWKNALDPPFPLTFEPNGTLRDPSSPVGKIVKVPTFVLVDPLGYAKGRHVGYPNQQDLAVLVQTGRPETVR